MYLNLGAPGKKRLKKSQSHTSFLAQYEKKKIKESNHMILLFDFIHIQIHQII